MNSIVGGSGAALQSWDAEAVSTVYGAGPVCTPPSITAHPQSVTVNAGEQTTLSVGANGTAPTFRWYQGSAPSTSVPLGALSTQTVTPSTTTNYWVRVSGCSTSVDSNTATVTVTCNPPAISGQPQSVTIQEGQQTTLSVSATAGSTFQWFIGASAGSGTPISGATSSSISVSPTTTTSYWVRVSACSETLDSNVATVEVTCAPPNITQQPQSRSILSGGTANLSVVATGSPFLTYQWFQGTTGNTSTPLGTTASINVSPTVTTSYWVRVSSSCAPAADSATATVTVTVCDSITIFQQPQPTAVLVNQKFTLEALHTGTAPFTYQWYRGVSGNTSSPVPGATGAALQTTVAVTTGFWVRIGNCAGTVDSDAATVTVTASCVNPSIVSQPAGSTINKGQSATLTVLTGGTNPTYQWFQGTAPGGTAIAGATSSSVTVTPTATTSYWVRVSACNQNVDSQTATVTVNVPNTRRRPARITPAQGKGRVRSN